MADNGISRLPPGLGVDLKTGQFNQATLRFLNTLIFGQGANTIGKVTSGIAQANKAAQAASEAAETVNTNTTQTSALDVSVSSATAQGSRYGSGLVTTSSVTVTASGGTGPYTYSWATQSGDDFAATSPSSATTTFTRTIAHGDYDFGVMRCTISDSEATPNTATIDVTCSALDTSFDLGL